MADAYVPRLKLQYEETLREEMAKEFGYVRRRFRRDAERSGPNFTWQLRVG